MDILILSRPSFFLRVSMDISFLDVSIMDILQVMIYSFGIFSSLGISLSFGLGSWKSWAFIFTSCSFFGMFSFFDPIYRGNSTKSQIGWDVHEIHFHIYMHIFMWSLSYVLVFLTIWSRWVWVPFSLCCSSRNIWRCIGCSAHSQGRCCHHVLIGVKLGWSMNYYLPSIGIYYILPMISR